MNDNVYLGNPNLKKANTQIEFTQENIIEFLKCKEDPVYFAKKYIKIVSLDEGLIPFKMYNFQKEMVGTCLLYTSPSPRDGIGSRMPSSA